MTVKECHSHCHDPKKKLYRLIIYCVIAFVVVVSLVILIFWAVTKPSKPSFVLQDVTVSQFNLSYTVPTTLSTTLQITIISKSPNDRIGVYYRSLDVYASYRNQQITLATSLPTTYQGHKDVNVWSPFLCGDEVPVAPFVGTALSQDLNTGRVLVNIKIDGRIKWKVGTWMSSKYHLHANCPAYIVLGGGDCHKPASTTFGGDCSQGGGDDCRKPASTTFGGDCSQGGDDCHKPASTTSGGDCSQGIPFEAPIKYHFAQGCNVDVAL